MSELIIKTRDALLQAGISPRKSLSQNFLINKAVLNRQIKYANLTEEDIVLEIGGGTGLLTEQLAKAAGKVYSIEYDRKLADYLKRKFQSHNNVTILAGDALKLEYPKVTKFIANLPYHISSPITFRLLDYDFDLAVLMYQYEFARRMVAKPRTDDYSRLSANLQFQAEVEILERVPRNCFLPMPKVDSALVQIKLKKEKLPISKKYYRITSRILFNTKNKLVCSVLYDYFKRIIPKAERITFKKQLDESLSFAKSRVRELSVEDLVKTTSEIMEFLQASNQLNLLK
ncbi:MAG: ribosomal RNA small subunit methyltransferase A [Candidatus Heimdallarchaeota archaeon]|nr:ribosomal RNA small subunit methyltransferase A [Candidatus Heimdallarchaeota archaeon]MCG3254170.1 ribosomal RNA small subunit methyltransferase A [Candidatus Heimdallarchaeota archaeon]MCK4291298.1 ribosomal RNA small subunit methyltransferase A [Candidatus Heimdallarchaeota archaeon]